MHIEVGKKIQTICLPSEFLLFFLASFHFLTICFVFSFCSVSYLSQSVSLLSFYLHLTQLMFYPACFSFTSLNKSVRTKPFLLQQWLLFPTALWIYHFHLCFLSLNTGLKLPVTYSKLFTAQASQKMLSE